MSLSASSAFRRSSEPLVVPADCSASMFCMPSVTATPSQCRDPPQGDPGSTQAAGLAASAQTAQTARADQRDPPLFFCAAFFCAADFAAGWRFAVVPLLPAGCFL